MALHAQASCPANAFTMVNEAINEAGSPRRLALVRVYGHGAPGSQNVSAGQAALDKHVTSLDPVSFQWALPLLIRLRPFFAPWGSMELHGCHVGHGKEGKWLLQTVADAVQVPVTAALWFQEAGRGQWTFDGPTVSTFPYGESLIGWSDAASKR